MAVISQPLSAKTVPSPAPVTYAPLTLSAVVVGFNIDRILGPASTSGEAAIAGERVKNVYLTPRLVAKLLTESYVDQFYGFNPTRPGTTTGLGWLAKNPVALTSDPEFLHFNPEFALLQCAGFVDCGGPIVEQPTSDAANELWQWVLADPEARAWLNGTPDQYSGMRVNPVYSTNASVNPSHIAFASPVPESFPKSDPYTYQNPTQLPGANNLMPRSLGMQDFIPYAGSMQAAALAGRTANDGDKLNLDSGAVSPDTAWTATGPQPLEQQFEITVTDSADAAQYGLQTASLSRAGDDGANRAFVAPTLSSMELGQHQMKASPVAGVLQPNVAGALSGAYPLPTLTYAAVTPATLTTPACRDYANLISYAAGRGQSQGTAPGQLPLGYAPLPSALAAQAVSAAHTIVTACGVQSSTSTTTSPTTAGLSNAGTGSSSSPSGSAGNTSASTAEPSGHTAIATPSLALSGSAGAIRSPGGPSPGRTSRTVVGAIRLAVPIIAGIGIVAALGSRWLDVWKRRIKRPQRVASPGAGWRGVVTKQLRRLRPVQ
jgi:hypothetical protein